MTLNKIIFVPTTMEVSEQWLLNTGFKLTDRITDNTALYIHNDIMVAISGIGKEPTLHTLQYMQQHMYLSLHHADILLTGTAGSYAINVRTITNCITPFNSLYSLQYPQARLVCVHEFITPQNPHPELHQPDTCFDMESEYFIQHLLSLPKESIHSFSLVKIISDSGNGSLEDWIQNTITHYRPLVHNIIENFIQL